ncbi:acyl-CoA dehydrogenase family protein [Xanthomonas graminis]|uniref:acyl-CoA dehydrogenase family protein n=1 Tax=Xanthomonas graminis TaxID=3390026 RepID=UPI001F44E192|nr:acyl-CoA dehydrogenase family protein [Xanthomonas translucens]UKE73359.1 hypothetical protein KFS85_20525 [Xanthomonas translucens pv. phleipratensis]
MKVIENWNGLGLRASGSGDVVFEECLVSSSELSMKGDWGKRDDRSLEARVASTAPLLGVSMGLISAARSQAKAHVAARQNRPNQGLSATEVDLLSEIEVAAGSATASFHFLFSRLDRELSDARSGSLSAPQARDLMSHTVIAGAAMERSAIRVVDLAMQVCGGAAFTALHPLGRMLRDSRALFFMRPYTPINQWRDFLAETHLMPDESM